MHDEIRLAGPDHVTVRHDLQRRLPRQGLLHALLMVAPLLAAVPAAAQTAGQQASSEHWIATWTAPQAARLDQPPQSLPASAQAFPWVRDIPQAVKDVTPGQELPVGGASPLQIKAQTLRQIAHVSLGGQRVRVVLSNSLEHFPSQLARE